MPRLVKGRPVAQSAPRLEVTNRLAPGRHRFQLEVVDDAGNRSRPDVVTVIVLPRAAAQAEISASPTPASGRR